MVNVLPGFKCQLQFLYTRYTRLAKIHVVYETGGKIPKVFSRLCDLVSVCGQNGTSLIMRKGRV